MTVPARNSFNNVSSNDFRNVSLPVPISNRSSSGPKLGKLSPDLYHSSNSISKEDVSSPGEITFTLKYDFTSETLHVFIVNVFNLQFCPKTTTMMDPFVELCLIPDTEKKFQTRIQKRTLNPLFNEMFSFSVKHRDLCERMLYFAVYDFDRRLAKPRNIGYFVLGDIVQNNLADEVFITESLLTQKLANKKKGELCVSLCHLAGAQRLVVTIHKAINLPAMDITGSSDPYVKVWLLHHEKKMRKKKTHVQKFTCHPVFNETLSFDISNTQLAITTLKIQVVDHDKYKQNDSIGSVDIGVNAGPEGLAHWNQMINSPCAVTQWHKLV